MSSEQPVEIMLGVAVAIYVVSKFLEWAPRLKMLLTNGKPPTVSLVSPSGNMPPEFWQLEFRKAVAEVVGPLLERMVLAEREQTEALRELTQEIRMDRAAEQGRREAGRKR